MPERMGRTEGLNPGVFFPTLHHLTDCRPTHPVSPEAQEQCVVFASPEKVFAHCQVLCHGPERLAPCRDHPPGAEFAPLNKNFSVPEIDVIHVEICQFKETHTG